MTKISRNLWILDHITFLTGMPSIPQSCGQAPGERSGNLQPWLPPGTRFYSQHRQIKFGSFEGQCHFQMQPKVQIPSSWLLSLLKDLQLPGSTSRHLAARLPGPPLSFPGFCPAVLHHSRSVQPNPPITLLLPPHLCSCWLPTYYSGRPIPSTPPECLLLLQEVYFCPLINSSDII